MGARRAAIRRSAGVAGTAALVVSLLAPAASAGQQSPTREAAPAGAEPNGTDYEISGRLLIDGNVAKLVNLTFPTPSALR